MLIDELVSKRRGIQSVALFDESLGQFGLLRYLRNIDEVIIFRGTYEGKLKIEFFR